jgi:hypothetical protein
MKSERLKKLELELEDLEQWLKLGLVPKKDMDKHKEEIRVIKEKIVEEKQRLLFMKENGDLEEYIAPKRNPARQAYAEPQTLPDMNMGNTDFGIDTETEGFDSETSAGTDSDKKEDVTFVEEDEEDPFSDKNRWKRGILEDPDADNW